MGSTYDLGDAETSVDAATRTPASPGPSLVGINYNLDSAERVSQETSQETDTGPRKRA